MAPPRTVGRFAPSTTGPAHPGTLLAALLCWFDVRAQAGQLVLRLEDLDPERCRPEFADDLKRALDWLGVDWDAEERQSHQRERYDAALDRLAGDGKLYACHCSRSEVRRAGGTASDGTPRYPGTCRARLVSIREWRETDLPLRVVVEGAPFVHDEDGTPLPRHETGDPIVRRRDGAIAYHLASVIDDAAAGVTRIVRGRDLAGSTAIQSALRQLLAFSPPVTRHHLVLLESRGTKLAKLHGSVGWKQLRDAACSDAIRNQLLGTAGLPANLAVGDFRWEAVATRDRLVRWEPPKLVWEEVVR